MQTLCVDVGSTFVKFFVYDGEKILLADRLEFPRPCLDDGIRYEVPLVEVKRTILEIFERTKALEVQRCYIAVQMHGYVLQGRDGSFSNYVSWKDRRGDVTHPLLQQVDFDRIGTSLKRNLPAVKLVEHSGGGTFYTLGSYISWLLTGRNVTHKTDGCACGFFHAQTLQPVCAPEGLSLPQVTHGVLPIGRFRGAQIYTPVGDHQLSFLGSGAEENGYLLNIGTATQISTLAEEYCREIPCEKRPYFDHRFLLTVSGLTGGEALFQGYDVQTFAEEVLAAIRRLPPKGCVMVGGGGADLVFDVLKERFASCGITCIKQTVNISQEGLIQLTNKGEAKIGTMLSEVCFPNFPVILKNAKVDFLIIDNEHGAFDYSFLSAIVMNARLVGLPLIVRLPDNQRRDITKLVDMGVTGFLLPMTNDADAIRQVVEYAKYAPIGKRGISTNRAHTFYNPPPIDEYMKTANEQVKV
jgi:hypothetical protein